MADLSTTSGQSELIGAAANGVAARALPSEDVEIGAFWDILATTREERMESVEAVHAYMRGDYEHVSEYLKRRNQRWRERTSLQSGKASDDDPS